MCFAGPCYAELFPVGGGNGGIFYQDQEPSKGNRWVQEWVHGLSGWQLNQGSRWVSPGTMCQVRRGELGSHPEETLTCREGHRKMR